MERPNAEPGGEDANKNGNQEDNPGQNKPDDPVIVEMRGKNALNQPKPESPGKVELVGNQDAC